LEQGILVDFIINARVLFLLAGIDSNIKKAWQLMKYQPMTVF